MSSSLVIARKPVCVVRGTKVTGAVRDHVDIAAMTRCRSAAEKFGAISYGMTPHSQYHCTLTKKDEVLPDDGWSLR